MICSRSLPVALVLTLLLLLPPPNASAGDDKVEDITVPHKWFFTLYTGPHAQPDLEHVLLFDMSIEDDTYIAVAALAREFWRYEDYISFEAERYLVKSTVAFISVCWESAAYRLPDEMILLRW